MSTNTIVAIVAVTLLLDVIIILVIRRMRRRKVEGHAELREQFAASGWRVLPTEGTDEIYRIAGDSPAGPEWQMVARHAKGGRGTIWSVPELMLRGDIIALGSFGMIDQLAQGEDVDLGHGLVQSALARLYGRGAAAELAGGSLVELDDVDTGPWVAFSTSEEGARRFIAEPVASILREWRTGEVPPPAVLFWRGGLELRFRDAIVDPERVEQTVMLGDLLALRAKELAA